MLCPACGSNNGEKKASVKFEDGEKFQVQCKKCQFLIKDFDGITWTMDFAQMVAKNLSMLYQQSDQMHMSKPSFNFLPKRNPAPNFKFEHIQIGDKKVERQSVGVFHAKEDAKFLPAVPTQPRFAQYRDYWIDLEQMKTYLEKHFLEGI